MTKSFSQYGEDIIINEYFGDRIGCLLDLGANDGITFSNSKLLLDKGWSGVLIEASPVTFKKLKQNYQNYEKVFCIEQCLSDVKKRTKFFHNIYHNNPNAKDNSDLLSTIDEESYQRTSGWGTFSSFEIECDTLENALKLSPYTKFDFVSIDIEGMDLQILHQMDLTKLGIELMVVEHNNTIKKEILEYCSDYGFNKIIFQNEVNIILHK